MDVVYDTQIIDIVHDTVYVYKSLSLYNGWPEIFHINIQTIIHFFNLWSKEVIVNVSYPSTINKIDEYLDASISPT